MPVGTKQPLERPPWVRWIDEGDRDAVLRWLGGGGDVESKEEAKGKRRPRLILLAGAAEVVARLARVRPAGKMFLNTRGRPWTTFVICCRSARLATKVGRQSAAYDLRHGFCQRLLEGGASHLAVAELLGHADGQMVATVYSHMNRATAHLREALLKAAW